MEYRRLQTSQLTKLCLTVMDINAFQHYNFLETGTRKGRPCLLRIYRSIRLYSVYKGRKNKYTDVKDIPENNFDAVKWCDRSYLLSNQLADQSLMLGNELATVANIKENKKNLTIYKIGSSRHQLLWLQPDAAVVNITFVREARHWRYKRPSSKKKPMNSKTMNNLICSETRLEEIRQRLTQWKKLSETPLMK